MEHAGTPHHSKEDCRDDDCQWHGPNSPVGNVTGGTAPVALDDRDHPAIGLDFVIQAARADAAAVRAGHPFLLHCDRTLFIVASEPNGWVVAELAFDPGACVFIERSRAQFAWPREAFGRLLSRVYIAGAVDTATYDTISASFERWLANQFVA
jgi:hypothetical protein